MSVVQDRSRTTSAAIVTRANRGTIVEPIFLLFGGRFGIAAIAVALTLFVAGLVIAAAIGFSSEYVRTPQIYLGFFSVVWVTWWIGWATRRLRAVMENVQPIFLVAPDRFRSEVERFEAWAFDWRLQIWGTLILWSYGCFDIYSRTRNEQLRVFDGQPLWTHEPHLLAKNLILMLWDFAEVALLITSAIGIVCYVGFVVNISRLPLVPYLALARLKLRGLTDFAVATGLAWSVGVCQVVLLYRLKFQPDQIVVVLVFTALGLGILIVPEWASHIALDRLRNAVLNEAIRRMKTATSADASDWSALADGMGASPNAGFDRAVQEAIDSTTWTYDIVNVSSVLGTWLLPLGALAVNSFVRP